MQRSCILDRTWHIALGFVGFFLVLALVGPAVGHIVGEAPGLMGVVVSNQGLCIDWCLALRDSQYPN